MELELTEDQVKAVQSLERAFKKCADANLYIHNCYGCLRAFDYAIVQYVDDVYSNAPCTDGVIIATPTVLDLVSWTDDPHFIHIRGE